MILKPRPSGRGEFTRYGALVLDEIAIAENVNPVHAVRAMAWLPEEAGDFLMDFLVDGILELRARGRIRIRKHPRRTLEKMLALQRERRDREIAEAYQLLGMDPPVTKEEDRAAARRAREILRKDRETFSFTFSKSGARTFVQGGAPGLKR